MAVGISSPDLTHDVRTLFHLGVVGNLSDGQLLERFVAGSPGNSSAEGAFAELARRHAPMVYRVSRTILGDTDAAQDAVQATFLILVHKAGSVQRRDSIASWLHGTALRVARRARSDAARRRVRERRCAVSEVIDPEPVEDRREGWPELHEELARLPEKYRVPLVLCYLNGLTAEAVAKQLDCPRGTILCRLSRGRERLRARLIRRGIMASSALLALDRLPAADAAISAEFTKSIVRTALQFATDGVSACSAGVASARGWTLAEGVLKTMLIAKLKAIGLILLVGASLLTTSPFSLLVRTQVIAQQTTAKVGQTAIDETDRWVKKLPSGAVVELVGISTYPSGLQTWWSPSGKRLSEPLYASGIDTVHIGKDEQAREFAVRIRNNPVKDAEHAWKFPDAIESGMAVLWNQPKRAGLGLEMIAETFPDNLNSCKIGFGITSGDWQTRATCGPRGEGPKGFDKLGLVFDRAEDFRGKAFIRIVQNGPKVHGKIQALAIDHQGKVHKPSYLTLMNFHGVDQQNLGFDLDLAAIKEIQFQTRPHEWAEFTGVPISPKTATEKPKAP